MKEGRIYGENLGFRFRQSHKPFIAIFLAFVVLVLLGCFVEFGLFFPPFPPASDLTSKT